VEVVEAVLALLDSMDQEAEAEVHKMDLVAVTQVVLVVLDIF
jgi:hypothetical protein